jgi:dTDP-4-amino-4,6-dideoxygalactose transaminase
MERMMRIAKKYHLYVVEDCAQSHGATQNGKMTGTFGDIGCFSFYPSKNLGAFGDAGAIVTDNDEIAQLFRVFRNYGSEKRYYNQMIGTNSRLDEIQAAMLRVRLKHLEELNAERRAICNRYLSEIRNPRIMMPKVRNGCETVWHQFVIRTKTRERFRNYLTENHIATLIHYPIPPHMQKAYEYLGLQEGDFAIAEEYAGEVLSLPLYHGMTKEEVDTVITVINRYV